MRSREPPARESKRQKTDNVNIIAAAAGLCLDMQIPTAWAFMQDVVHDGLAVVPLKNRGLGVVAKRSFVKGERILAEAPILRWVVKQSDIGSGGAVSTATLESLVDSLDDDARAAYFALSQSAERFGPEKSAAGVWMTNAFPAPHPDEKQRGEQAAGVFAIICRINHECNPNAHQQWNHPLGKATLHASRAIEAGSEVTISYFGQNGRTRAERAERGEQAFGFRCICSLCQLRGEAGRKSDERQKRIGVLGQRIEASPTDHGVIQLVETKAQLLSEEGLPDQWALADFHRCMMQRESRGDAQGAKEWARRASERALIAGGEDCPSYLMYAEAARRVITPSSSGKSAKKAAKAARQRG